jgi:hypothetical protein
MTVSPARPRDRRRSSPPTGCRYLCRRGAVVEFKYVALRRARGDPRPKRRPSRGDCAARNSRAQGAPRCIVRLRPRCAQLTASTARAASNFLASIDGRRGSCLTTASGGASVGSSSSAASRSPLPHRPGVEHVRTGGPRPRFVPPIPNSLPGRLFVRRHVHGTDGRTGLRFGLRPGADPACNPRGHHAAAAIRRSDVDA